MVRAPSCDKTGLKKGAWTPEEDTKLIAYITRYGAWNWRLLPRFAGLARCGKSCRLRWLNYLRPNIKRGNYTEEEEKTIIRLHEKLGNKWSVIATHLPGRTDNEIKNHWHTTLKKRFVKNTVGSENGTKSKQERDSPTTSLTSGDPFSPLSSSSQFSSIDASSEILSGEDGFNFEDVNENMWTESYLSDICYAPLETVPDFQGSDTTGSPHAWELDQYLVPENDHLTLLETTQQTTEIFWTQPYVPDMSHVPNELLVPLLNESDEYLLPMYDVDLWSQSNSHACLFQ